MPPKKKVSLSEALESRIGSHRAPGARCSAWRALEELEKKSGKKDRDIFEEWLAMDRSDPKWLSAKQLTEVLNDLGIYTVKHVQLGHHRRQGCSCAKGSEGQ